MIFWILFRTPKTEYIFKMTSVSSFLLFFFLSIFNFDKIYFHENIEWEIEHQLTHTVWSLFSEPINETLALIVSQIIIYFVPRTLNGKWYRTPNNSTKTVFFSLFFISKYPICKYCVVDSVFTVHIVYRAQTTHILSQILTLMSVNCAIHAFIYSSIS